MKVSALIVAYNEHELIGACLRQIPGWVEKVLVLVSESPWNGHRSNEDQKMWEILQKAEPRHSNQAYEVKKLNWRSESDQRNWGLGRLADYDWALQVDADEFYTPEDWEKLRLLLERLPANASIVVADEMLTYWKTTEYVWSPADSHKPVIAIRPTKTVFFDKRSPVSEIQSEAKITMHHLSWVKSDESIKQKITNWSHSKDFDPEVWYNNVWLKWNIDMIGLRPYGAGKEIRAIHSPLPESIKRYMG